MPAHSRSKNGVASLAYGRGHPRLTCDQSTSKTWMAGTCPAMTESVIECPPGRGTQMPARRYGTGTPPGVCMAELTFRCPYSNQPIKTGIDVDRADADRIRALPVRIGGPHSTC